MLHPFTSESTDYSALVSIDAFLPTISPSRSSLSRGRFIRSIILVIRKGPSICVGPVKDFANALPSGRRKEVPRGPLGLESRTR